MPSTTHPEFDAQTEGLDVAKAFADQIRGRTFLITGVNRGGIGFSTAEALASQSPSHLIVAGRSPVRLQESITALRALHPSVTYHPLEIDLSSQSSVRAAAATVLSWSDITQIDILINSAGVMLLPERTITSDGVEMHLATNHVGHFLLTCLLLPKLITSAKEGKKGSTRVVNVTSASPLFTPSFRWSDPTFSVLNKDLPPSEQPVYARHRMWGVSDPEDRAYLPLEGYNQSKVANVLFSVALSRHMFAKHGILSIAAHPGVIQTELGRHMAPETRKALEAMHENGTWTYKTLGGGAATSLVAALDPGLGEGEVGETKEGKENYGLYLADCRVCDKAMPGVVSSAEAERLWKLTEELVGDKFEP